MSSQTLLVGQSGGPTAVINASLAGVLEEASAVGAFSRILGMRYGVQGALQNDLADLTALSRKPASLDRLASTPSAALGSCRYKLQGDDLSRLVDLLRRECVGVFVYIGGNDSAETAHQVEQAARAAGLSGLRVVGVPKTIDNDLAGMDHCPGYGSAARFVAQTTRETALDTQALRSTDPIRFMEVMGRYAGWLPAAAWLARDEPDDAPHLVYVPEHPVTIQQVVSDVSAVVERLGWCVAVMCENQTEPGGAVIGAGGEPRWMDAFGHPYYDSPVQALTQRISTELGRRARFDKPGTIQRMATAYVSTVDRAEARELGRAAVRWCLGGASGVMMALIREPGPRYAVRTATVPLQTVANAQQLLPAAYVNAAGNGLNPGFEAYARPLLGEPLPSFERL